MTDHLKFDGNEVKPKSEAGAFTQEKLNLNDRDSLVYRKLVTSMLTEFSAKLKSVEKKLKAIQRQLQNHTTDEKLLLQEAKLLKGVKALKGHLTKLSR